MRKKPSLLLLFVFAVFLGIAIFHPLSHGLHHDEDDGHECPICLWLHHAVILFSAVVFCIFLRLVSHIFILPRTPVVKTLMSVGISRAPPQAYC